MQDIIARVHHNGRCASRREDVDCDNDGFLRAWLQHSCTPKSKKHTDHVNP